MKKRLIFIIVAVVLLLCYVLLSLSHPTYYKYNDWWIIGRSVEEVEKRYGFFDIEDGCRKGYFIGYDDGWVMPSFLPEYYWIEFDNEGLAVEVWIGGPPGG